MAKFNEITPAMVDLLRKAGSPRYNESCDAMAEVAKGFAQVLRQGVLVGDVFEGVFTDIPLTTNSTPEFPLDLYNPTNSKEFVAYTMPNQGTVPHRLVEGDYVMVPIYDTANAIQWPLKYARDARWDVIGRCKEVFMNGFTKKNSDDRAHVLMAAALDRNILVFDGDANAGQFTKRVLSLAKVIMRRNGGGNSNSMNRSVLTDVYLSPECLEDVRNWNVDQVDEITRREIYTAADGAINRIFSVNLHDVDEFGEGQEYQTYFTNILGGTLASGDLELMLGLDLTKNDSFVHPIRSPIEVFDDPTLHRQRQAGIYGNQEAGLGVLDGRRTIFLSC